MKPFAIVAALLLAPGLVHAQTVIDEPMDSIRQISGGITYSLSFQLETLSPTTGNPVVTGTATKKVVNLLKESVLFVDLAGNKTGLPKTISSVRFTYSMASADGGWEEVTAYVGRKRFNPPFALAAGQFVGCRYDMPSFEISITSLTTTAFELVTKVMNLVFGSPVKTATVTVSPMKGNLKCAIGVKAESIPEPVKVVPPPPAPPAPPPPPAADPPVVPAPAPGTDPTITAPNKAGDASPPLPHLISSDGAQWGLDAGVIRRNGVVIAAPYVDIKWLEIPSTGLMLSFSGTHGYSCWIGIGWTSATRC